MFVDLGRQQWSIPPSSRHARLLSTGSATDGSEANRRTFGGSSRNRHRILRLEKGGPSKEPCNRSSVWWVIRSRCWGWLQRWTASVWPWWRWCCWLAGSRHCGGSSERAIGEQERKYCLIPESDAKPEPSTKEFEEAVKRLRELDDPQEKNATLFQADPKNKKGGSQRTRRTCHLKAGFAPCLGPSKMKRGLARGDQSPVPAMAACSEGPREGAMLSPTKMDIEEETKKRLRQHAFAPHLGRSGS